MSRKNTHMTHIDEALFEGGQSTTKQIKRILESGSFKLSVKWDGAPSIFVGHDPLDGQFFIGTKSVFNKTPILYKDVQDIMANEPVMKAYKLIEAFKYLQMLSIPKGTVLQGDLIFTNTSLRMRDGYVTAHANTLIYAWPIESEEALDIINSDIGVVFHTTYTGEDNLQEYTANFGCDVESLNVPEEIWVKSADADIDLDVSDLTIPTMSAKANFIVDTMAMLPDSRIGAHIKSFYNHRVRLAYTHRPYVTDYVRFVNEYYDTKVLPKLKSEAGKKKAEAELEHFLFKVVSDREAFYEAFAYVEQMEKIKREILSQINEQMNQKVFVSINDTLCTTTHEGYVLIDTDTGDAFKIVDRMNFSYYNFSKAVKKGWES